jgi:hypothetical protein
MGFQKNCILCTERFFQKIPASSASAFLKKIKAGFPAPVFPAGKKNKTPVFTNPFFKNLRTVNYWPLTFRSDGPGVIGGSN